jgi:membrane protein
VVGVGVRRLVHPGGQRRVGGPRGASALAQVLLRIGLTALLLLLSAVTALAVVLTGPIAEQAGAVVGLSDRAIDAWQLAMWPVLAAAVMTLVAVLYWASPNVDTFATYSELYGPIGGVLVFLLWLWVTNIALLLGAEPNAEIERARAIEAGMRPEDKTPYLPLRHA